MNIQSRYILKELKWQLLSSGYFNTRKEQIGGQVGAKGTVGKVCLPNTVTSTAMGASALPQWLGSVTRQSKNKIVRLPNSWLSLTMPKAKRSKTKQNRGWVIVTQKFTLSGPSGSWRETSSWRSPRAIITSQQLGPERAQPHTPLLVTLEWMFRKLFLHSSKLVTMTLGSRFEK